jgi:heptaprenyl diphosphate synthase
MAYRIGRGRLSPVGVSATGAAGHALGQVLGGRLLVIQHDAVWQVLPFLLLFAVFSGVLTGWLVTLLLEELKKHPAFLETNGSFHPLGRKKT